MGSLEQSTSSPVRTISWQGPLETRRGAMGLRTASPYRSTTWPMGQPSATGRRAIVP